MALRHRESHREGLFNGKEAKRAIIDIGSNTVRLVVYGGNPRAPIVLMNEKVRARLGRELEGTGRLAPEAVAMALRALGRFALILHDLEIRDIETVATAAARDASNGDEFLAEVEALGLKPQLLAGEDEARISAMGILGAFPDATGLVADLGGGSLELTPVSEGSEGGGISLPLGTLRLPEIRSEKAEASERFRERLANRLKKGGCAKKVGGTLYLVGGTWRAMAVYSIVQTSYALTDPHGYDLSAKKAAALAEELKGADPRGLCVIPRISTMRSQTLPDAAHLLLALLDRVKPDRVVFSSWGVREGLLYDRLAPDARAQDPLLTGVSFFAADRGVPPILATQLAGWTVDAVPRQSKGSERLRLAATMLSLASMQVEPNMRTRFGIDWALHKRWINVDPQGRAMLAAAISANGNQLDLPAQVTSLASKAMIEEAIIWGLATRLARRLGACSRHSLRASHLKVADGRLVLCLEKSHAALVGISTEKDLSLLADRLGLEPDFEICPYNAIA